MRHGITQCLGIIFFECWYALFSKALANIYFQYLTCGVIEEFVSMAMSRARAQCLLRNKCRWKMNKKVFLGLLKVLFLKRFCEDLYHNIYLKNSTLLYSSFCLLSAISILWARRSFTLLFVRSWNCYPWVNTTASPLNMILQPNFFRKKFCYLGWKNMEEIPFASGPRERWFQFNCGVTTLSANMRHWFTWQIWSLNS